MRSLCDYLHDPEHILPCLEEGYFFQNISFKINLQYFLDIPSTLLDLLEDKDQFCRLKSAECYYVIASKYQLIK